MRQTTPALYQLELVKPRLILGSESAFVPAASIPIIHTQARSFHKVRFHTILTSGLMTPSS